MSAADPVDIPLLAPLSKRDREAVLSASRQRTFGPGQVLVREGEKNRVVGVQTKDARAASRVRSAPSHRSPAAPPASASGSA